MLIRISQINRPIDHRDEDGPAEALLMVTKALSGETGQESYRLQSTLSCTARQTSTLQRTPRKFPPLVDSRGARSTHLFRVHCITRFRYRRSLPAPPLHRRARKSAA